MAGESASVRAARVWAALLVALGAALLGGGTGLEAMAVIVLSIGAVATLFPERDGVSRPGLWLGGAFLFTAADGCFLPALWFHLPWRDQLVRAGFALPPAISPQPWLSLHAWLLVLAGLVWIRWIWGQRFTVGERWWLAGGLAIGIGLIAGISLLAWRAGYVPPGWNATLHFGPFANRNQTATLLALGAFLALVCGMERWGRGISMPSAPSSTEFMRLALASGLWLGLLLIDTAALAVNRSRSGPLLFLGLSVVWLVTSAVRRRNPKVLAIALSLALLAGSVFLVEGRALLARYGRETLVDFRLKIFRDTTEMIRASPWTGTGLDSFSSVFPQYRHASILQERVLHPESDWLWLAAETGLPGCLAAGVLLAWLARQGARGFAETPDRHLRWALCLGAAGFAAHSLGDVPAHRFGTVLPALLIFGLGLSPGEAGAASAAGQQSGRFAGWVSRLASWSVLVCGVIFTVALLAGKAWPAAGGLEMLDAAAEREIAAGQNEAAVATLSRALALAPLDWRLHFNRGALEARLGRVTAALEDFRQARFLEPHFAGLPLDEGMTWLALVPRLALNAWQEAMRRTPEERRAEQFQQILGATYGQPALRDGIWKLAALRADLQLAYIGRAEREDAPGRIASLLRSDPDLQRFTAGQRELLFALWQDKGDAAGLESYLARHPEQRQQAWKAESARQAARGDFTGAVKLCLEHVPPPLVPPGIRGLSIPEAEERFRKDPSDSAAGIALYRSQEESGQREEALNTLRQMSSAAAPPAYVWYLEAELQAKSGQGEAAWQSMQHYLAAPH